MDVVADLIELYEDKGTAQYGGEAISQSEHALQCAALAESEGAPPGLVAAALLHDLGHLLAKGRAENQDDLHERIGAAFLARYFDPSVSEPVRLHVDAKRYLCATEAGYFETLSPVSVRSLELQGGRFAPDEAKAFEKATYWTDAIQLRRWDDLGKVPGATTKTFGDYAAMLRELCR